MTQTQLEYYNGLYVAQLTDDRQQQLQDKLKEVHLSQHEIDNIMSAKIGDISYLNVYKLLGMV